MEADRGYPQAASAHDTFWDFIGLMPEIDPHDHVGHVGPHHPALAAHDGGLRRQHLPPAQRERRERRSSNSTGGRSSGLQSTCWDEAVKIAGADPDYHRRDLFEAIDSRRLPGVGVRRAAAQPGRGRRAAVRHPRRHQGDPGGAGPDPIVGRLVLNRNPDNFFAETEQAAFLPTNVPPGIDFSEDPLLQGRLFSYQDTQLSRLGTVNFHQIPINRAKGCPFQNLQRDGHMQTRCSRAAPTTSPTAWPRPARWAGPREDPDGGFRSFALPLEETKVRLRAESFADHYSHARLFFRSQTEIEQAHLASALVFELSKVTLRARAQPRDGQPAQCRRRPRRARRRRPQHAAAAEKRGCSRAAGHGSLSRPCASSASIRRRWKGASVGILVTDGADGKSSRP